MLSTTSIARWRPGYRRSRYSATGGFAISARDQRASTIAVMARPASVAQCMTEGTPRARRELDEIERVRYLARTSRMTSASGRTPTASARPGLGVRSSSIHRRHTAAERPSGDDGDRRRMSTIGSDTPTRRAAPAAQQQAEDQGAPSPPGPPVVAGDRGSTPVAHGRACITDEIAQRCPPCATTADAREPEEQKAYMAQHHQDRISGGAG